MCPKCGRLTEVGQKCLGCAPLPRRRRRSPASRIVSAVLFAGAAAALLAGIAYVGSDSFQKTDGTSKDTTPTTLAAQVGAQVKDNGTTFSVSKLECSEVGFEQNGSTLGRQKRCLVAIRLKGDPGVQVRFRPELQRLVTAADGDYRFDAIRTIALAESAGTGTQRLLEPIPTGSVVEGVLVFTVPSTAAITEIEFHGVSVSAQGVPAASGKGVRVKVRPITLPPSPSVPLDAPRSSVPLDTPVPVTGPSDTPRTFAPSGITTIPPFSTRTSLPGSVSTSTTAAD